ncbi:MAG: universal stress protein [Balneolaceae bacterium]|jgi:nucleotide-binding universal stress UspA family protein
MKKINKILVPTDFSENAIPAYTHAEEIARKFGATIDFIHVIPTLKYFNQSISRLGVPFDMDEDLYPSAQKEADHQIEKIMNDYIKEEYKGKSICKIERKPSSAISEVAKDGGYDLIVMASRGEHDTHLLRGSTAEKVIRHSEVPVFTVDARLSSEGLKRILVPTDGSMLSFSVLPTALMLADTYDAEITLYHVLELYGSPLADEIRNPQKSDEANVYEALLDHLDDYLIEEELDDIQIARGEVDFEDRFVMTEGASSHSIAFQTVIERGVSAHLAIQEYAAEHADVVVMATHGHSGLAHFFLGSTTENVAQHLDLPVVTVKPSREKMKEK